MIKRIVALSVACCAPSASPALTLIGTGTGIIYGIADGVSIDDNGFFGPPGISLIGKTATITISIDLDRTPPLIFSNGQAAVTSGEFNAFPGFDPSRGADIGGGSITIDSVTRVNAGESLTSYTYLPAGTGASCPGTTSCSFLGTTTGPGRFGGSFTLGLVARQFSSGAPTSLFDLPLGSNICERAADCIGQYYDSMGGFTSVSVRLSSLSLSVLGVPEPSSWAMFIGGFGMIGAAMRRHRRVSFGRA